MFERYLTDALTKNFGHIIENLDADQVRLSTWNGQVHLEDVSLRRDSFDHFVKDSPVEIAYGRVGKLSLTIPWKLVRSQMWRGNSDGSQQKIEVVLTDVNVLITPRRIYENEDELDEISSAENSQVGRNDDQEAAEKEESVQTMIDTLLLGRIAASSRSSSRWKWVQERLAGTLSTLSVTIQNIHVRYEDAGNCMGFVWNVNAPAQRYRSSFSIGITLKEFSLSSQKSEEESEGETKDPRFRLRRKTAAADSLALYWDTGSRIMSQRAHLNDFDTSLEEAEVFQCAFELLNNSSNASGQLVERRSPFSSRRKYVLDPFSPSIEFSLVTGVENKRCVPGSPPSTVSISFPPCRITLSRGLLEDLGYLRQSAKIWSQLRSSTLSPDKIRRLTELRPRASPIRDPRGWWQYAHEAVLVVHGSEHSVSRGRGWQRFAQAVLRRHQYVNLYRSLMLSSDKTAMASIHQNMLQVERGLSISEIAQFRVYACQRLLVDGLVAVVEDPDEIPTSVVASASLVSFAVRTRRFQEIAGALSRVDANEKRWKAAELERESFASETERAAESVSWKTALDCNELSVQVNEMHRLQTAMRSRTSGVVRASFSFSVNQHLLYDGSWFIGATIHDLVLKDCSVQGQKGLFPNLFGSRESDETASITLSISRKRKWVGGENRGSTTTTSMKVKPFEVVYATDPVETLTRLFHSVHVDLADDYQRMSARLHGWRERQKTRLIAALSHKEKAILVNIEVCAPTLLVPENMLDSAPLLVFEIGRLRFANSAENNLPGQPKRLGDRWELSLDRVRVECTRTGVYKGGMGQSSMSPAKVQQVVEPFSLTLSVLTSFGARDETENSVSLAASLPRLAINLTASVWHLLLRLRRQWDQKQTLNFSENGELPRRGREAVPLRAQPAVGVESVGFVFLFEFSVTAPLLKLNLQDDVKLAENGASRGLLNLTIFGAQAKISKKNQQGSLSEFRWTASMASLDVVDVYQKAGPSFSHLISSFPPELHNEENRLSSRSTDLVSFEFVSGISKEVSGSLTACFHELYMEWNPETLAVLHRAMKLPLDSSLPSENSGALDDDIFFDAEEEDFFDADSEASECESADLSEIGSSQHSSFADLTQFQKSPIAFRSPFSQLLPPSPSGKFGTTWAGFSPSSLMTSQPEEPLEAKPFVIKITLAKVRIHFNKEVRHRRVFIAEMDKTSCEIKRIRSGGSVTTATIGNLVFSDPAGHEGATLYREVLGLKNDVASVSDSLLELEIVSKVRARTYVRTQPVTPSRGHGVEIDRVKGTASGEDLSIKARFSPMRFVYLQQLWFEIIDYFFEGIIGYEVWGGVRPQQVSALAVDPVIETAEAFAFLKLDIALQAPVILIPISYCSTNYLQCSLDRVCIENYYRFLPMRRAVTDTDHHPNSRQWFNNCSIKLEKWRLRGWSGAPLSNEGDALVSADLLISWPTGPTATLNSPKWNVSCQFDETLRLVLLKDDFALFRHLVSTNLGEPSRHMEEWVALQTLPQPVMEDYLRNLRVKYGYDKKNGTPSTFDVAVQAPNVVLRLQSQSLQDLATVRASSPRWRYLKKSDLVSKQSIDCSVAIFDGDQEGSRILLSTRSSRPIKENGVPLGYTSISDPSGDNTKSLRIDGGRIDVHYLAWKRLASFFQSLPPPTYLSPNEVIQVGDRWYRIGESSLSDSGIISPPKKLKWLPLINSTQDSSHRDDRTPQFRFNIDLVTPSVVLGDADGQVVLSMKGLSYSHCGKAGIVQRHFDLDQIEARVLKDGKISNLNQTSLIQPWSFSAEVGLCSLASCQCESHTFHATAGVLRAQASFTDMVVASNVCLRVYRNAKTESYEVGASAGGDRVEIDSVGSQVLHPLQRSASFELEGLVLNVVDDSGRHFADSQEIIRLDISKAAFSRLTMRRLKDPEVCLLHTENDGETLYLTSRYSISVRELTLIDGLQAHESPFRTLAYCGSSRSENRSDSSSLSPSHEYAIDLNYQTALNESDFNLVSGSFLVQYNPSLVIALQRFLGRMRKEITFSEDDQIKLSAGTSKANKSPNNSSTLRAAFLLKSVSITLNKEHQGRSLARFLLQYVSLDLARSANGSCVSGGVRSILVKDTDSLHLPDANQSIFRSLDGRQFLSFRYQTFASRKIPSSMDNELPMWLKSQLVVDTRIDDFLEAQMSSVELVFLSGRSKEILDYLSNGLPGRGMGATTRAAKGFVQERIEKRSFFQVKAEAPSIVIPRADEELLGFQFGGDILLESWVVAGDQTRRNLEFAIKNFQLFSYNGVSVPLHVLVDNLDVGLSIERRPGLMKMACQVATLVLYLPYSDYVLCREVASTNIGRQIDRTKWDNLEASWESEGVTEGHTFSRDIQYSGNARYVRYGVSRKKENPKLSKVVGELKVGLASLTLRRDDYDGGHGTDYDILGARLVGFEVTTSKSSDGIQGSMMIGRFDMRDLGEQGRQARDIKLGLVRKLSQFSTIVEGYTVPDHEADQNSQLVVSVERTTEEEASGNSTTNVSIVVNNLRIVVLPTPLRELTDFFRSGWDLLPSRIGETTQSKQSEGQTDPSSSGGPISDGSKLAVRLVLHYPQIVLVANENDAHSKTLVLSGLAIVNGTRRQIRNIQIEGQQAYGTEKILKADMQHISSYVYPDATDFFETKGGDLSSHSGVALLLPLTLGIDFEEQRSVHFVRKSLAVSVEEVVVVLGAGDLQVLKSLQRKLSRDKISNAEDANDASFNEARKYTVSFQEEQLGLGLRRQQERIVVDSTTNPSVLVGDRVVSISGESLENSTLSDVVHKLQESSRPLVIEFSRPVQKILPTKRTTNSKLDLSVSSAKVTLVDANAQFIQGELTGTRVQVQAADDSVTADTAISISSTIGVDYSNFRIHEWEPVVEPSYLSCSLELTREQSTGARTIAVEVGDRETGPLLLNATDSCIAVLANARTILFGDNYNKTLISGDAGGATDLADVAYRFARRQAEHSATTPKRETATASDPKARGAEMKGKATVVVRNMLPVGFSCKLYSDEHGISICPGQLQTLVIPKGRSTSMKFFCCCWSPWYELDIESTSEHYDFRISIEEEKKPPLSLNVRVNRQALDRVELFVYTELWFLNTTNLPICFGAPRNQLFSAEDMMPSTPEAEASIAEAALKEISSLFDLTEDYPGTGETTPGVGTQDILPLPGQSGVVVTEEIFEYIKVQESLVKRRWWSGEKYSPISIGSIFRGTSEDLLNSGWRLDETGETIDGWESSSSLASFRRTFSASDKYRRRRFYRQEDTPPALVNGFHQPVEPNDPTKSTQIAIAVQVGGGKWSTSDIPRHGKVFGAMRVMAGRWPDPSQGTYEICYSISPLDGAWGDVSRMLLVSSRFNVRNLSKKMVFEIKQSGEHREEKILRIEPGNTASFHWTSSSLPELIAVRPASSTTSSSYKWSGGFDPVTIGAIPLRVRLYDKHNPGADHITTVRMESEIRPKSGGTGINLSLVEEDAERGQSLFRIENLSPFLVWYSQDGILYGDGGGEHSEGDLIQPSSTCSFGLDIPFRQGKYAGRKAISIEELMRLRLSLAPQASREGVETTKMISLTSTGATVRLNPSKLMLLTPEIRTEIQRVRVLGVIFNDGPTRVLRLSLIRKLESSTFSNPFTDDIANVGYLSSNSALAKFIPEICRGGLQASEMTRADKPIPLEEEVIAGTFSPLDSELRRSILGSSPDELVSGGTLVSFRLAFSGLVVSFIDSSPSEIAVLSLRNLNALASWNAPRTKDATIFVTVEDVQLDNMTPNAPFPIAICKSDTSSPTETEDSKAPLLVVGLSFAPEHKSGVVCLKSVTIAPRNLAVRVDLGFLVRIQKFALDAKAHFVTLDEKEDQVMELPDLQKKIEEAHKLVTAGIDSQKLYFGGLTILPCNIRLSVSPARALTPAQAAIEGAEVAAIHQAVRKGDVKLGDSSALLGVKIGSRNSTPLAVARGVLKSIVVDALLRLDGASLNFAGVSLRNHVSTGSQLATHIGAHYLSSLRQNVPALLASMEAFGNPLGLVRGLGDGVSDFVLEPIKGFQRSIQELDASFFMDGVARGTVSLARHTVGGFANSAASLTETFSKNMTVLTLDRRYAQKRDRGDNLRDMEDVNVALGLGSGVQKLVQGFLDGVTGVVKAPIRGANQRGFEGFAKGIGKGLLGLLVKPVIGISDGITDFMIGVKATIEGATGPSTALTQVRPRRALVGEKRILRPYNLADAAAQALIQRTCLAGEYYLGHLDMGDRVALFGVRRMLLLGSNGEEQLVLKYKNIRSIEKRKVPLDDGKTGWCLIVLLNIRRRNGADMEVVTCEEERHASDLRKLFEQALAVTKESHHEHEE